MHWETKNIHVTSCNMNLLYGEYALDCCGLGPNPLHQGT